MPRGRRLGLVLGSSHRVRCIFTVNAAHGRPDRYAGSISKFGVDVGYQASAVIVWAVLADRPPGPRRPRRPLRRGDRQRRRRRGVGANVLIGGFRRSVTLQPVSFSVETGLNVAAGIGELTLTPYHGRDQGRDW